MQPSDAPLLEVENVSVRFGGITAVDRCQFTLEPGRVAGLIGPNGAGKTTTFNVITGLQDPTEGRILIDGKDVSSTSVEKRARMGMARTFQRLEVFGSLSVFDNVLVAAEIYKSWSGDSRDPRATAAEAIRLVGVEPFVDQPADSVPTGVARMTELARALTTQPRILLLDEPSSGLSDEESVDFGNLLIELASRGVSILMVEHDVDLVMRVCDWIDVLDFGHVIASGTADMIRTDPKVQAAYLGEDDPEDGTEDAA